MIREFRKHWSFDLRLILYNEVCRFVISVYPCSNPGDNERIVGSLPTVSESHQLFARTGWEAYHRGPSVYKGNQTRRLSFCQGLKHQGIQTKGLRSSDFISGFVFWKYSVGFKGFCVLVISMASCLAPGLFILFCFWRWDLTYPRLALNLLCNLRQPWTPDALYLNLLSAGITTTPILFIAGNWTQVRALCALGKRSAS